MAATLVSLQDMQRRSHQHAVSTGIIDSALSLHCLAGIPEDKDGNCLPSALARAAFGSAERHNTMRIAVVDLFEMASEQYKGLVMDDETATAYASRMPKPGQCGGGLLRQVFSDVVGQGIDLYTDIPAKPTMEVRPKAVFDAAALEDVPSLRLGIRALLVYRGGLTATPPALRLAYFAGFHCDCCSDL